MTIVRIGIGQIESRVGDFEGNVARILAAVRSASELGVELMVFPEKTVTGYPAEDLAFRGSFIHASETAMQTIARETSWSRMVLVVGGIESGVELFNAAAVIHRGKILGWARKRHLFCCGRFDESRYFSSGSRPLVIESDKFRAVVTIGEDFGYPVFPAEIELLINLWNEPYHHGHRPVRDTMMIEKAREDAVAIAIVSPIGGQDDLIFEGSSAIVDGFGETLARGQAFGEDLVVADLDLRELQAHRKRIFHAARPSENHLEKAERIIIPAAWNQRKKPAKILSAIAPLHKGPREIFSALCLATADYVRKNGFDHAIIGVSGGIDSSLVAVIAKEALGAKKVTAVSMPGPYTSPGARRDAKKLARSLGVNFKEIPIEEAFISMLDTLAPAFGKRPPDVTEENLQARIRGLLLISLANKFGAMVLVTSNKSEAACGYCTIYGDTCGGFAPLVDVYKTRVYEIAYWLNKKAKKELIPAGVIERAPSAELRPGQTDQDTLPPYLDLDRILKGFLEEGRSVSELIEDGESEETVFQVMRMLMNAEFKRRQAPIGPTISERPLSELRLPVTKSTGWWLERKAATVKPERGKSRGGG